jgi:5-methylthioadenosine/S-adenosylhomocysteine deaminase
VSTTLIKDVDVITVDAQRRIIEDGYVLVDGDRIAAVGDSLTCPSADSVDRVMSRPGCIITPGLINLHQHHWYNLFRGLGDGMLLEDWVDNVLLPLGRSMTNQAMELSSSLAALEMLATGTTCFLNHLVVPSDSERVSAIVEPAAAVGIRQIVAKELRHTTARPLSPRYPIEHRHPRSLEEEIALARDVVTHADGIHEGRVRVALALETQGNWLLHNATSEELIFAAAELASQHNLKITDHCSAGTPWRAIREYRQLTGRGDVEYLLNLGVLSERFILVHCVWLLDREIEMIAEARASVVICPASNAFSAVGVAPLPRLKSAAINIALGSDGPMVNNSIDMVEQMKFAALIQNVTAYDPALVTPEFALEAATINGARALGLERELGSIEVGKKADLVVFDLRRPHCSPVHRPVSSLVMSAHGTDAAVVMVDGRVVYEDGRYPTFGDVDSLIAACRTTAQQIANSAGLAHALQGPWQGQQSLQASLLAIDG